MDPRQFYQFAHDLLPPQGRFTPTHQFIRLLQNRNVLLRNYTQNIDNVEAAAGLLPEKVIHCHGSWATATCRLCKTTVPGENIFASIKDRAVPSCTACTAVGGNKRKRTEKPKPRKKTTNRDFDDNDEDEDDDAPEIGVMKVSESISGLI
jgi:NAD-dependent histone deacetylase SIR2